VFSFLNCTKSQRREGANQWLPSDEGHKNTCKNNKISVLRYFSYPTLNTKSRGIMAAIKGRK
jgi:hypothetical protein